MDDLRKRFGRLVAAHRRRQGLTQAQLAERAEVSVDLISKIEIGKTGARFGNIERIARALHVDPAELFTTEVSGGLLKRGAYHDLSIQLAELSDDELLWVKGVVGAALKRHGKT